MVRIRVEQIRVNVQGHPRTVMPQHARRGALTFAQARMALEACHMPRIMRRHHRQIRTTQGGYIRSSVMPMSCYADHSLAARESGCPTVPGTAVHSRRATVLLARTTVQSIAKDKGIHTKNLYGDIEKVADENIITSQLKEKAHEIRFLVSDTADGDLNPQWMRMMHRTSSDSWICCLTTSISNRSPYRNVKDLRKKRTQASPHS